MSGKLKIGIALRCFNRIADALVNVQRIIPSYSAYDYYVVVVSNGTEKGYRYPSGSGEQRHVALTRSEDHLSGDAQLFECGVQALAEAGVTYGIIMTSDTWLLDETKIIKYIQLLRCSAAIWASSSWCRMREAATDLAFIKVADVVNAKVFLQGEKSPETWVYDRLQSLGPMAYQNIAEIYPVHYFDTGIWPRFCFDPAFRFPWHGTRICYFPRMGMVTHHVECLPGKIDSKMKYANECVGRNFFAEIPWSRAQSHLRALAADQFARAFAARR